MPTISEFFGIYIAMYVNDHLPPHFHVEYQGKEAQVLIQTGEVVRGNLSRNAGHLVEEWRKLHVDELMENWENARKLIIPKKIAPLE